MSQVSNSKSPKCSGRFGWLHYIYLMYIIVYIYRMSQQKPSLCPINGFVLPPFQFVSTFHLCFPPLPYDSLVKHPKDLAKSSPDTYYIEVVFLGHYNLTTKNRSSRASFHRASHLPHQDDHRQQSSAIQSCSKSPHKNPTPRKTRRKTDSPCPTTKTPGTQMGYIQYIPFSFLGC